MKKQPTLAVRFRNAATFMMDELQDRLEDLPLIGRWLERRRDARNKHKLIKFSIETEDEFREIKLYAPEGMNKDAWKELILSKVENPYDLKSISETHLSLSFWYLESLENKYTPDEALKFMRNNEIPGKDVLANLFGNNSRTPALKP